MRILIALFCLFLFGYQIEAAATVTTAPTTKSAAPDPKCSQPLEVGPCRMKLPRFYYNSATKTCESFIYGGCKGNDNRFGIQSACENACKPKKK